MSNKCEFVLQVFLMSCVFALLYSSLEFSADTRCGKGSQQHRYNGE